MARLTLAPQEEEEEAAEASEASEVRPHAERRNRPSRPHSVCPYCQLRRSHAGCCYRYQDDASDVAPSRAEPADEEAVRAAP